MTPKQQERIKNKIKKIKAALAADKKHWGGYFHDGQGLRYSPPRLYIQLDDFTGGLRYLNWFNKNFPDDSGFPDFLFEWTIILYKTGRLKEAEKMAFRTFKSNTYLFDKFFGKQITSIDKFESSNLDKADFAIHYFDYSNTQNNLLDFAGWLEKLIQTEKFINVTTIYIDIYRQLEAEKDYKTRKHLLDQAERLENEL